MEQNTVRKIWNVISALILLLVVAAEGILFYRIYGLMMIPDTYLLVLQLKRVQMGEYTLPEDLQPGEWVEIFPPSGGNR